MPVKVGFIGCGNQATGNIYPHLASIREADLVACCDLVESLSRRNADRFNIPHWYTDYNEMLGQHELDAIFVVGPPRMHHDIGLEMLEGGYHVFTEKPTAETVEEAKALSDAADASDRRTQVGHMLPHAPASKTARRVMESGDFGTPIFCESKYFVPGPRDVIRWGSPTLDWTFMLVQAVHPVDWARQMMGDIATVSCARGEGDNGAISYVVSCEFASGAAGLINMTSAAPHVVAQMELVGDKGTFISIDNCIRIRYEGSAWGQPIEHDYGRREAGYFDEVQDFCKCIQSGEPTYSTWQDEYKAFLVCQAICDSIDRGGKRVSVPE